MEAGPDRQTRQTSQKPFLEIQVFSSCNRGAWEPYPTARRNGHHRQQFRKRRAQIQQKQSPLEGGYPRMVGEQLPRPQIDDAVRDGSEVLLDVQQRLEVGLKEVILARAHNV
jgi:hypothetical protein